MPAKQAIVILSLLLAVSPAIATDSMSDQEAEAFLRTAKIQAIKPLGKGVTLSNVVTLSEGTFTAKAVWKTIDEYEGVKRFNDGGPPEIGFRDSYKSEIAAYILDRLIGLNQVPPTVAREIEGKRGSLQLWVDGAMTEGERIQAGKKPPDVESFNQQMRRAKVFFQLIQDVDYKNMSNLLIDSNFKVYKIDSSRAFRTRKKTLLDPEKPDQYSRSLLEKLKRLDEKTLRQATGLDLVGWRIKGTPNWLNKAQRSALLERRDLIIKRAEDLVEKFGADRVLYP